MTADPLYAIIGSNVVAIAVVGGVVGTFFWPTVARLDRRIDNDKVAADAEQRVGRWVTHPAAQQWSLIALDRLTGELKGQAREDWPTWVER